MSDDTELNSTESTVPEGAPVAAAPRASSGDFLSTGAGKAVLIAAAVVVLLVVAGVIGWFVLGPASLGTGTPSEPTVVVPSPGTPAPSTPASPSVVATLPVADITSRDVFSPRNPFKVIKPAVIPTSTASSNNNNSSNNDDDSNTLTLTDIITVGGVPKAVLKLGGVTYTVGEGDMVGSSDYKVQSIGTSSIDVLYGDDLFTISETDK